MLSINTNLSSLIAQNSLSKSTNALNQAIERLSTGYKINHAGDNAANYSISTDMTTQLGGYNMAADNVSMGLDLVNTASDILNLMSDNASRLRALCVQARNGTYGAESLAAIQTEANSILAHIAMTYNNAEYNGIKLFTGGDGGGSDVPGGLPEDLKTNGTLNGKSLEANAAEHNGFIVDPVDYSDAEVAAMEKVADVATFQNGHTYSISSKAELIKLANFVNSAASGHTVSGVTFVLGDDIDLEGMEWTPIGDYSTNSSYTFKGTFDGNGHTISNFEINNPTKNYQGLFGYVNGGTIKNVGVEDFEITAKSYAGGVAGYLYNNSSITNSYGTGNVTANNDSAGGVAGYLYNNSSITNSYGTGSVTADSHAGGVAGHLYKNSSITNSYGTGSVTANLDQAGGVAGYLLDYSSITNSYGTGSVTANSSAGGVAGCLYNNSSITNSYGTGSVTANNNYAGGVAGSLTSGCSITNSYGTGSVTANNKYAGGVAGCLYNNSSITNSCSTGDVSGTSWVGGLVGQVGAYNGNNTVTISDSISYSNVSGTNQTGSFIGGYVGKRGSYTTTLNLSNCGALELEGIDMIEGYYTTTNGSTFVKDPSYDLSPLLAKISVVEKPTPAGGGSITLQVGIHSDSSNQISFDTSFSYDLSAVTSGIQTDAAMSAIDEFLRTVSAKSTDLGAVSSRLDSALDSIGVNIENLTSSRSTLRDADVAKVSSQYIMQQILQQASATLLSTANQTPSIALQLI